MKPTVEHYAQAFVAACHDSGDAAVDAIIENLLRVVRTDGNEPLIPEIVHAIEDLLATERTTPEASATFARVATADKSTFDTLHTAAGAALREHKGVDDALVGGVVIRVDDTLVDGSIKGELARMQEQLSE